MVCTIDLLPGATLKKVKSILEQKAMEKYIAKALKQKFISPSTSPATSSFNCKKDGGLRPCIDYRRLSSSVIHFLWSQPL